MKRIIALLSALLIFVVALSSCSSDKGQEKESDGTAQIGIFSYTGRKTNLSYHDSKLTKLSSNQFDFPSLGSYSYPTIHTDDKIYIVSEGNSEDYLNPTDDEVVMIDLKTKESKVLSLSFPAILQMFAHGNYVYTITGLNYKSTLTRLDAATGEKKEFKLDGFGMNHVYACGDTVYLACGDLLATDPYSKLYVLDENTLTVKKTYDIENYFFNVNSMLEVDGQLYIAPLSKLGRNGEELFISDLIRFDPQTEEFEVLETGAQYPCSEIVKYNDDLIISNSNPITVQGQEFTIYNPKTNKFTVKEVDSPTIHFEINGNYLYRLSMDKISVYDLTDYKFEKTAEMDTIVDDAYVSTFFAF